MTCFVSEPTIKRLRFASDISSLKSRQQRSWSYSQIYHPVLTAVESTISSLWTTELVTASTSIRIVNHMKKQKIFTLRNKR